MAGSGGWRGGVHRLRGGPRCAAAAGTPSWTSMLAVERNTGGVGERMDGWGAFPLQKKKRKCTPGRQSKTISPGEGPTRTTLERWHALPAPSVRPTPPPPPHPAIVAQTPLWWGCLSSPHLSLPSLPEARAHLRGARNPAGRHGQSSRRSRPGRGTRLHGRRPRTKDGGEHLGRRRGPWHPRGAVVPFPPLLILVIVGNFLPCPNRAIHPNTRKGEGEERGRTVKAGQTGAQQWGAM